MQRAPTAQPQLKKFIQKFLLHVCPVERWLTTSGVCESLHLRFWTDMTGTASQEDRLSKLHFDPNVFSVTIIQHAGGHTTRRWAERARGFVPFRARSDCQGCSRCLRQERAGSRELRLQVHAHLN